VRPRQVAEPAPPEAIAANPAWREHHERTRDEPAATADGVVWADAVLLGSPTRYGNVASRQWQKGLLADEVYAGFTSSRTAHGGQEPTLLTLAA
jgi:NAD(P)H dehydrogenase (quinone)